MLICFEELHCSNSNSGVPSSVVLAAVVDLLGQLLHCSLGRRRLTYD